MPTIGWYTIPPQIIITELAEEDAETAWHIRNQLGELTLYVDRFSAALALIERSRSEVSDLKAARTAEKNRLRGTPEYMRVHDAQKEFMDLIHRLHTWIQMAARDAVMTIWDFTRTVVEIRYNLDSCPSLNALVPRPQLEKALGEMGKAFPNRKYTRHAAAHPADMGKTRKERNRHATSEKIELDGFLSSGGNVSLSSVITGDGVVSWTYEGRLIQAHINEGGLANLIRIREMVFECFSNAEKETRGRLKERMFSKRNNPSI